MFTKTTNSVMITVSPVYDIKNSYPSDNRFVFKYTISIQNFGPNTIKIEKRRWMIYDLGYGFTEILGDGVIGMTPEIPPGEKFDYFSNVILRSGVGNMSGKYIATDMHSKKELYIEIPKFELLSEVLSN